MEATEIDREAEEDYSNNRDESVGGGNGNNTGCTQQTKDPKNTGKRKMKLSMRENQEHINEVQQVMNTNKYMRVDNSIKQEACQLSRDKKMNARQVKEHVEAKYGMQLSLKTVQSWLRSSAKLLAATRDSLHKKAMHGGHYSDLEHVLHETLIDYETVNGVVTDVTIRQHAQEVASDLGYIGVGGLSGEKGESMTAQDESDSRIKFSQKWLSNIKKRFGWHHHKIRGEGASADVEKAERARQKLPTILSGLVVNGEDIYNVDETGLQFQMPPGKQITSGMNRSQGEKAARSRIAFTLCSNVSGNNRMPLQAIVPMNGGQDGREPRPKSIPRSVNVRRSLGVIYHYNKNAWQYGSTWSSFLLDFKVFVSERRLGNVVLVCDNCLAHKPPEFCEWERITYDEEGVGCRV
jgi:hypothetical protein